MDPYAIPLLPQFNPNQPYHDDLHASSNTEYYNPYWEPIPHTLNDGSVDGHENTPMNTYPPGSQSRSPGFAVADRWGLKMFIIGFIWAILSENSPFMEKMMVGIDDIKFAELAFY